MNNVTKRHFPENKRYKIVSPLGEGGMGTVFLALDQELNRRVAIKVIRPEVLSNQSVIRRTMLEAKLLSRLKHPSLASIYEMDMKGNPPYIVQQYIDGKDLRSIIDSGKVLSPKKIWKLFLEQAQVLEYIHNQNIFHRDIKPENIMIEKSGTSILMDFGLALDGDRTRMTRDGNFVGTISYCAPEVLKGNDGGAPSDVYQLGLVVFEAATGTSAFKHFETVNEFVALLFSQTWEDEFLNSGLPESLGQLIRRCCSFDPSQRPSDGAELCTLIKASQVRHKRQSSSRRLPPSKDPDTESGETSAVHNKSDHLIKKQRLKMLIFSAVFLSICLSAFLFSRSGREDSLNGILHLPGIQDASSSTISRIPQIAREYIMTPDGFYVFLPSTIGREPHWKVFLKDTNKELFNGRFTKIAGGWVAHLKTQTISPSVKVKLAVFEGSTLVAEHAYSSPESILSKSFSVSFSYKGISCSWKYHGKAKSTIKVSASGNVQNNAGENTVFFTVLTKTTERNSLFIPAEELGEGKTFRVSLNLPQAQEHPVASVDGSIEMDLIALLSTNGASLNPKAIDDPFNLEDDSHKRIKFIDYCEGYIHAVSRAGFLHRYRVNDSSTPLITFLWKKDLRIIPELSNVPSTKSRYLPPELLGLTLIGKDNEVRLYGLGDTSKVFIFNNNGALATNRLPFFHSESQWKQKLAQTPNSKIEVLKVKDGLLYSWGNKRQKQFFFTGNDSEESVPVEYRSENCKLANKYNSGGETFFHIISGDIHTIAKLVVKKTKVVIQNLCTLPVEKTNRLIPLAMNSDSTRGLLFLNDQLKVIKKAGGGLILSDLHTSLPANVIVTSIMHHENNEFFCAGARTFGAPQLSEKRIGALIIVSVKLGKENEEAVKIIDLTDQTILDPKKRNIEGPYIIDRERYAFTANNFLYILSSDDHRTLYKRTYAYTLDWVKVTSTFILTAEFYYGGFYGMSL